LEVIARGRGTEVEWFGNDLKWFGNDLKWLGTELKWFGKAIVDVFLFHPDFKGNIRSFHAVG
jgi:hypothetical protein